MKPSLAKSLSDILAFLEALEARDPVSARDERDSQRAHQLAQRLRAEGFARDPLHESLEKRVSKLEDWVTARNGDTERRLEALEASKDRLRDVQRDQLRRELAAKAAQQAQAKPAAERFRQGRHKQARGVTVVVDDTAQADAAHALDELRESLRDMVKDHRERADRPNRDPLARNVWTEAANLLEELLEAAP